MPVGRLILSGVVMIGITVYAVPARASTLVLIPVEFTFLELSLGGVIDAMPDETAQSREHLSQAVPARIARRLDTSIVELPPVDEAERESVREHTVLFEVVAREALTLRWRHKLRSRAYTIGPGLGFLADRTGAERAIFVTGAEIDGTAPREVAAFGGMVAGLPISSGGAILLVGIVDLRTGTIEWLDYYEYYGRRSSPRTMDGARYLVDRVFQKFPRSRVFPGRFE